MYVTIELKHGGRRSDHVTQTDIQEHINVLEELLARFVPSTYRYRIAVADIVSILEAIKRELPSKYRVPGR